MHLHVIVKLWIKPCWRINASRHPKAGQISKSNRLELNLWWKNTKLPPENSEVQVFVRFGLQRVEMWRYQSQVVGFRCTDVWLMFECGESGLLRAFRIKKCGTLAKNFSSKLNIPFLSFGEEQDNTRMEGNCVEFSVVGCVWPSIFNAAKDNSVGSTE